MTPARPRLLFLLLFVVASFAGRAARADTRTVARDDAALRAVPGFDTAPLAVLLPGTSVDVLERQNEWMRVESSTGPVGWIHEVFLTAAAPSPESPETPSGTEPEEAAPAPAPDAPSEASVTPVETGAAESVVPEGPATDPDAETVSEAVVRDELPRSAPGAASRITRLDTSRRETARTATRRPRPTPMPPAPAWPVASLQGVDDLDSCRDRLLTSESRLARAMAGVAAAEEERDAAKAEAFRAAARTPDTEASGLLEARLERTTVALVAAQADARAARAEAEDARDAVAQVREASSIVERAVKLSESELRQTREATQATLGELARTRSELSAALDRAARLEAELGRARPAPPRAAAAPSGPAAARADASASDASGLARLQSAHAAQLTRLEDEHAREVTELKASHEQVYARFIDFVTQRHEEELARKTAAIQEQFDGRLLAEKQAHLAQIRSVSRDSGWQQDFDAAVRAQVAVEVEEARLRWEGKRRGDANDLQLGLHSQAERLERECEERRVADVAAAQQSAKADFDRRLDLLRAEADLTCQRALEIVLERAAMGEDVSGARRLLPAPGTASPSRTDEP